MSRFKIGDRVTVTSSQYNHFKVGDVTTIVKRSDVGAPAGIAAWVLKTLNPREYNNQHLREDQIKHYICDKLDLI
jgi:hypothetical protein